MRSASNYCLDIYIFNHVTAQLVCPAQCKHVDSRIDRPSLEHTMHSLTCGQAPLAHDLRLVYHTRTAWCDSGVLHLHAGSLSYGGMTVFRIYKLRLEG